MTSEWRLDGDPEPSYQHLLEQRSLPAEPDGLHLALLDPDADEEAIDAFVAALVGEVRHYSGRHDQHEHGKWAGHAALDAPTDMGNFNAAGQAVMTKKMKAIADYGAKNGTPGCPTTAEGMSAEVLRKYREATPDQIERGSRWYQDVHDGTAAAAKENGYTDEQGAGVMARCSPQRNWDENYPMGKLIMATTRADAEYDIDQATYDKLRIKPPRGPGRYRPSELDPETDAFANPAYRPSFVRHARDWSSQVSSSIRILRSDDPMTTIDKELGGSRGAPKIRNFYNNIHDPSDPWSVTIDTHQIRAMLPDGIKLGKVRVKGVPKEITSENVDTSFFFGWGSVPGGIKGGTGSYPMFASGMQLAAKSLQAGGVHITPQQLQAITWLVQREGGAK